MFSVVVVVVPFSNSTPPPEPQLNVSVATVSPPSPPPASVQRIRDCSQYGRRASVHIMFSIFTSAEHIHGCSTGHCASVHIHSFDISWIVCMLHFPALYCETTKTRTAQYQIVSCVILKKGTYRKVLTHSYLETLKGS